MTNILYIPDLHLKPGQDPIRMKWIGRLIAEWRPDVVVQAGDAWDMPSLSSYDVGKKSFEGRSYKTDLEAGHKGFDLLEEEIKNAYRDDRERKKRGYNPSKYLLGGNHDEGRVRKIVDGDRKLDGTIGVQDFHRSGWTWVPFLQPIELGGVYFCHYFISGVMGKPIGGENPATSLLNKMHKSCVAAHTHLYDYSERTTAGGNKIQALLGGCLLAEDQWEDYAGPANHLWRNCVTKFYDVKDGQFDFEMVSAKRLKHLYG